MPSGSRLPILLLSWSGSRLVEEKKQAENRRTFLVAYLEPTYPQASLPLHPWPLAGSRIGPAGRLIDSATAWKFSRTGPPYPSGPLCPSTDWTLTELN